MPPGRALSAERLRVLGRRKGTVALVTVVFVGVALAFSLLQTPVYASSARLLIEPRTTESLFDTNAPVRLDPARLIRNEIQVLKSEPVQDAVRDTIGSAPNVDVTSVGDTDVVTIRAEDVNANRAARIANAYAEAYIAFRQQQALDDLQLAGKEVQAKVDELQGQIDALDQRVADTPSSQREALRLSLAQQRQELVSTYSLFRQRLDQIQVEAPLRSGGAQVVGRAKAGSEPVRPRPVRSGIVALILGLGAGVALALLRDHLDDSLKSKEDLEEASGLPVVGMLPVATGGRNKAAGEPYVVTLDEPTSPAAEAYRTLRTSVQFLSLDRPVRTLMVSSPGAGEGKTTIIANLGVVLARAGVPVVLVGCDLRRPRIHEVFGLSNAVGFTSVLLGDVSLDQALQRVPGLDRLRVLPAGPVPPNPSELLALRRTTEVLASIAASGALVLIDSPPVLPVTDALVLAAKVDAVLLVGVAGVTNRRDATRAAELLGQVQAPLVGAVLNAVTSEAGYGYSYGFYADSRPGARKEAANQ